jgi:hypothetical protein
MNFIGKWRLRGGFLADIKLQIGVVYTGIIHTSTAEFPGVWNLEGNSSLDEYDLIQRFTGENSEERFREALQKLRSGK